MKGFSDILLTDLDLIEFALTEFVLPDFILTHLAAANWTVIPFIKPSYNALLIKEVVAI